MTSEFPAGLTRQDIETVLNYSNDVVAHSRHPQAAALWTVTLAAEGNPPVEMLVDNGVNDVYVQVLVQIPAESVGYAIDAVAPFQSVGVVRVSGTYYLRTAFFINDSTIHALVNAMRSIAFAYLALAQAQYPNG